MSIENYGAALPKKFKGKDWGVNPNLNIQNLCRCIVLGPSFSGKNNAIMHILKHSPNIYSHIHIIARNSDQELYNYLRDRLQGFITFYDADNVPSVDSIKSNGALQIVIIDDFSNDKRLQRDVFSHFFTRGRHKLLTTYFLAHSYFATDKMIRLNSEYLMILKANSRRDLEMVVKDFTIEGLTKEKIMRAYNKATAEKGQLLLVDSVRGELRYNFDKKIEINEL